MGPDSLEIFSTTNDSISVTWKNISVGHLHGIMRYFTLSCNGTLANGVLHGQVYNIPYLEFQQDYTFTASGLYPHTNYSIYVRGCTTPGCGAAAILTQATKEMGKFLKTC